MDVFDILTMIGGLCLFLFGMNIMGQALERSAGDKLKGLLAKMTGKKLSGFITGLGVTAIIQSSSATTVMVVGFVNSGLLSLRQAINVIMGANVGTTVTAWVLSLGSIDGKSVFVQLLKPSSFTPVLALVGIALFMFSKNSRKKDIGAVLLGFATLMFGMETMTGAVSVLKDIPAFQNLFLLFSNPLLGVLAGALLTAIIQSSSASVGILQALAATGAVSYGAAIPIIMGQNIGTCVTALISSVGTTKNARRAAFVHLSFNVIGTAVCLIAFCVVKYFIAPPFLLASAGMSGIAIAHSAFNIFCTMLLFPLSGQLEKLALKIVPEGKKKDKDTVVLDERLIATPALALKQARAVAEDMCYYAVNGLKKSMSSLGGAIPSESSDEIKACEEMTDHYEDIIGSYLLKLGAGNLLSNPDSEEVTALLKVIGDFERIGDHAVNILESGIELSEKKLEFSGAAKDELSVMTSAVGEVLDLALEAFVKSDMAIAVKVEPLEQVIDGLKEQLRTNHIQRMKKGDCSVEAGFVWSDLLTNLERVSDHCSNIAGCVIDLKKHSMSIHETLHESVKDNTSYEDTYKAYQNKYAVKAER